MAVSGVGRRECAVADGSVIPIDADGGLANGLVGLTANCLSSREE